jgi:hypothetical protein
MYGVRSMRRGLVEIDYDYDDTDEGGGQAESGAAGAYGDFLALDGGRLFVKKFHVDAVAWEEYIVENTTPPKRDWRLRLAIDGETYRIFGDECAAIMRQLDLPTGPPVRPMQAPCQGDVR